MNISVSHTPGYSGICPYEGKASLQYDGNKKGGAKAPPFLQLLKEIIFFLFS